MYCTRTCRVPLHGCLKLTCGSLTVWSTRGPEVASTVHLHPVPLAFAAGLPAEGQFATRGLGRLQGRVDRFIAQLQGQGLAIAALVAVAIARGHPPEVLAGRQRLRRRRSVPGVLCSCSGCSKFGSAAICSTLLRAPGARLQRKRGRSLLMVCPCSGPPSVAAGLVAEFEIGAGVEAFHTLRIHGAQQDTQLAGGRSPIASRVSVVVAANSRISGVADSTTSTR